MQLNKLTRKHVKNTSWPKEKKIQAVTQYLALGNMKLVEATTGVSHGVLRQWKLQPWWKEYEIEIRNTQNLRLDNDLTKIVERSLETVADRLENGEFILNNKTGELVRKPVNMKDAAKVSTDLLTKRELLRGNATARSEVTQVPVTDQLKMLAEQFALMTQPKREIIDVEAVEILQSDVDDAVEYLGEDDALYDERETGLQEGSGEVHVETFGGEEADGTERGSPGNGEGREGT